MLSPSTNKAFLIGIGTSIEGGGIWAITWGSSYGATLDIWEASVRYPSAALWSPKAIWWRAASIPLESASYWHGVSSKLEAAELSLSAVTVISSLDSSLEEMGSLYESTVTSLFCVKSSSGTAGRLSSLGMCWVYSLSGSDLINKGFNF